MPGFEPKNLGYVLERLASRVVSRSRLTDLVSGGAVWSVLAATAREVDDVYSQMVNMRDEWDLDKARGTALDLRGEDIPDGALERRLASKATLSLVFSRSGTTGAVSIPAGTVVRVPDGGPAFATSTSGSISNGDNDSAAITAVAVVAGADGNVDLGTVTQIDGLAGVETVTNTTTGSGGSDREPDDEYRERMRFYLRSLSRGTADALKYAALSVDLGDDNFGHVVSVQVLEAPGGVRGLTHLYIDDGNGTVDHVDDNVGTPEAVLTNATGGERRVYVANTPIDQRADFVLEVNGVLVDEADYRLDHTTGLVAFDETAYPDGLTTGDDVTAEYTWFIGLVAEVQKVIEGDPDDRANYPGYKAAGTQVYVLAPDVTQLAIQAAITPDASFGGTSEAIKSAVSSAFVRYVNGLGIGEDVIWTELVHHAQSVPGVRDIHFVTPTTNVTVGEGELIRLAAGNIELT